MNVQKNQIYEMEIQGVTNEGNGVGRLDGYAVFVPGTAPGDRCRIRMVKCNKHYGFGRVEQVLTPSPDRIPPDCPVYRPCGGCTYRHIRYEAELKIKEGVVRDAFRRLGGIEAPVRPILGSRQTDGYRNKAQYPVGIDREGRMISGFYAQRSHRIVECPGCALQPPLFGAVQGEVLRLAERFGIPPYEEGTGRGQLRHIYLRQGTVSGELMICLITVSADLPGLKPLARELAGRFPEIAGVVVNENPLDTNVILGPVCRTLWGKGTITDVLCGVELELSPQAFYQVNHAQAEALYRKALAYGALDRETVLLDLYCGAGSIGLAAAGQVKELIGVEVVPEAVENARANAQRNGIQNARFLCGDAGSAASALALEGVRPDVVIVDPPRKGLGPEVIPAISRMGPDRVVMVSCNPATAARDAALLRDAGYSIEEIQPVDLFPRTTHVETVVLLSKLCTEHHIEVDLDLGDMDLTSAESKATYDEIKAYVLEKFGLKVSSLYISQIKRKCGLEVGENYNHPKSENTKVPTCPPEKETAIRKALEHFKVV